MKSWFGNEPVLVEVAESNCTHAVVVNKHESAKIGADRTSELCAVLAQLSEANVHGGKLSTGERLCEIGSTPLALRGDK